MKRLNLEDFKSKNLDHSSTSTTEAILGQVLGDCHDGSSDDNDDNSNSGGFAYTVGQGIGRLARAISDLF